MVLTRRMAQASKRQTRSMRQAAVRPEPHRALPAVNSRRPPARKRRARAIAARRASDASSILPNASSPARLPSPLVEENEDIIVQPAALPTDPALIDQPHSVGTSSSIPEQEEIQQSTVVADQPPGSALSPPILGQEQMRQSGSVSSSAIIQQPSSPLQRSSTLVQDTSTAPQNESSLLTILPTITLHSAETPQAQLPNVSSTANTDPSASSSESAPLPTISLDFLKPRPESEPLNPLPDFMQSFFAPGILGTKRLEGQAKNPRIIPYKVQPEAESEDLDYDDDPKAPVKPKRRPYFSMFVYEIKDKATPPCSIAVIPITTKLPEAQRKHNAKMRCEYLKGNSAIIRRAELKSNIRRKPYFWFRNRVENVRRDLQLRRLRREDLRGAKVERLVEGLKDWQLTRCYDASPLGMNVVVGIEEHDKAVEGNVAGLRENADVEMRLE